MKTKTMHHPLIPNVTADVPEGDVEDWSEQGWLKSAPKSSAASAADKSGDNQEGK